MKKIFIAIPLLFVLSCKQKINEKSPADRLNGLAIQYVRLALTIGLYDTDFVDAYYGPDSLRPVAPKQAVFPKDSLLKSVDRLINRFKEFAAHETNDTLRTRAEWMTQQLTAFGRRIKIFTGEYAGFDEESKELFGAVAPSHPEEFYKLLVQQLDSILPGKGAIPARFQQLANRFIIPENKLDTVLKTTIAECRRRTKEHYTLPVNETFELEYVTNKPWSGYNWYKGNYKSVIQINTDIDIFIDRAIDVGSHESYPGHHVYNMLLEKNLYHDKGWVEISLYPLYSPQSLIAEGSANYGIEVVFPGEEKIYFTKEVLLPLAGLDTAGIGLYFRALSVKSALNFARNEVGRGLLNGSFTEAEATRWLKEYCLNNDETAAKALSFIKASRSYIINYNYGMELVKKYIESKGGTADAPVKRWELFGWLLSNEVMPADLKRAEVKSPPG
ncbi:MAG TPA: hypothetical protein VJY62_16060 [Bacteroidia bacterium]|nr:hypothetical protein [Bacteroidia bacterium]